MRDDPAPQMEGAPGYWQAETSGMLRPVVEAYLNGAPLNAFQTATMRAYLRQWISAPVWAPLPEIQELRRSVAWLQDRKAIDAWLDRAEAAGIDPL